MKTRQQAHAFGAGRVTLEMLSLVGHALLVGVVVSVVMAAPVVWLAAITS